MTLPVGATGVHTSLAVPLQQSWKGASVGGVNPPGLRADALNKFSLPPPETTTVGAE